MSLPAPCIKAHLLRLTLYVGAVFPAPISGFQYIPVCNTEAGECR